MKNFIVLFLLINASAFSQITNFYSGSSNSEQNARDNFSISVGAGTHYGAPITDGISLGVSATLFKYFYISIGKISENNETLKLGGGAAGVQVPISISSNSELILTAGYAAISSYHFSGGTVSSSTYMPGTYMGGAGNFGAIFGIDVQFGYKQYLWKKLYILGAVGYANGKNEGAQSDLSKYKSLAGTTIDFGYGNKVTYGPAKVIREPSYSSVSFSVGIGFAF